MSALPLELLPDTAVVDDRDTLHIGGCDVLELAERFGTPLFVYDETHLRARCREAVAAFPDGVVYAAKAFLCGAMARLAVSEGMGLDVATGGEIHMALAAGVPGDRLVFHGNNKSPHEIEKALAAGVGRIVVDSLSEIDRIEAAVAAGREPPSVLVRVNPGVEAYTHEFLRTGATDSKFGISVLSGEAARAVARISGSPHMRFKGIHAHVGSQVFELESFHQAVQALAAFVKEVGAGEVSFGGGLGVPYVEGETAPSIGEWGAVLTSTAREAGITSKLVAEPGRSIVAQAAITLYTAGTIKDVPGVRRYVSVDGGMSDNPRPVLYGSGYEIFMPRRAAAERSLAIRVVGKHCESGDVLVWEGHVPSDLMEGDIVSTPVTGAYGHSMGSNYNMVLRPPVVFVADGNARLVVRRETYDDLLTRDLELG